MHRIEKVLNNNALIIRDEINEIEMLIMDKGVGFNAKINADFDISTAENVYYLDKKDELEMANSVNPILLEVCNEILITAKNHFNKSVDTDILLPLADHIAFALKRMENNIVISNPFAEDIRILFPDEYQVALEARRIIKEKLKVDIVDDEVAYITLHIHSALSEDSVADSINRTKLIQESILLIEDKLSIKVDIHSTVYARLVNHLKYLMVRIANHESLDMEMDSYIKNKFPKAYEVGIDVAKFFEEKLNCNIPEVEIDYLAIHIQRILLSSKAC